MFCTFAVSQLKKRYRAEIFNAYIQMGQRGLHVDPLVYQAVREKLANQELCGKHARSSESERELPPPPPRPSRTQVQRTYVRGGCNRCRGTVDQEDMGAISGEVERLLPRVGSLENPGERESGGSSRDVGALERGEAHAGLPRVEGEQSNELSSMLVQCPGCASVLKHNAGASPYLLSCDGAEHAGSKDIRMCERFSCLVCGRFVHALWSLYACLYLHVTHANVAFMSDDREVVRTIMQLF